MIINAINHSPLSNTFSLPIQPIISLSFSAFKCENEAIFDLKWVKNPEKTLKFASKMNLNAKGERIQKGGELLVGVWSRA